MSTRLSGDRSNRPLRIVRDLVAAQLLARKDRFPRPQWSDIEERLERSGDLEDERVWDAIAEAWLRELCSATGPDYVVDRSPKFLLASSLSRGTRDGLLEFSEKARSRIFGMLPGLAVVHGLGPHVIIVFEEHAAYYEYIAPFYPDAGHFATNSGLHLRDGYMHFVLPSGDLDQMKAVLSHELAHALLAHLPLPRWLNEGIAVNVESALNPRFASLLRGNWLKRHEKFWTNELIQEYWLGSSFSRPDEGAKLSYEMAAAMVKSMAADYESFRSFVDNAKWEDAGQASAIGYLGRGLGAYFGAFLGDGDWDPSPERWGL